MKMPTRITPNTDTFYAALPSNRVSSDINLIKKVIIKKNLTPISDMA